MVYWESIDTLRKLAIAAIPVFVSPQPGGSVQALAGQAVMVGTAAAGLAVRPYAAPEDNWLLVGSSIGEKRGKEKRAGEGGTRGLFLFSPSIPSIPAHPPALTPLSIHKKKTKKNSVLWLILLSGGALKWARLSSFQMLALSGVQMALSAAIAALVAGLVVWRFGAAGLAKARATWRAGGRLARRLLRRGGGGGGGGDGRVAPAPSSSSTAGFADRLASKFGGVGGGVGASGKAVRLEDEAASAPLAPPAPLAPAGGSGGSADMATALLGSGGSGASGGGSGAGTPREGAGAASTTPRASAGGGSGAAAGPSSYGPPGHTPRASGATVYRTTGTPRGY
jgi:hypothetical protein